MKNLAEEIIELLNFLKPENENKRDEIFTKEDQIHLIKFKPNGKNIKRKIIRLCFIFRGNIPFTLLKELILVKYQKDYYLPL